MRFLYILFLLSYIQIALGQTVVNGGFSMGDFGWECLPEATFPEPTYGGLDLTNIVAEVDAEAGLCQTIPGFEIGALYSLNFVCSRRVTCGPITQTMDVSIDGGALTPTNVSRTGLFILTPENFEFVATSTIHTINFTATILATCGLVVDNITIEPISLLPIELTEIHLKLTPECTVDLNWIVNSEKNNDYFMIQRSVNGTVWEDIGKVFGVGNSNYPVNYSYIDISPHIGLSYYRLKQVDQSGKHTFYQAISLTNWECGVSIYPNPINDQLFIKGIQNKTDIKIWDILGRQVNNYTIKYDTYIYSLDLHKLIAGTYFIKIAGNTFKITKL